MILDTLSLEATKEYTKKMGRWRRRAIEVSGDPLYWAIMVVMHSTREPLIHFSNWLKQKPKDDESILQTSTSTGTVRGKVSDIVNGKCEDIMKEFRRLFFTGWEHTPEFENLPLQQLPYVKTLIFHCIAVHASQFNRRILQKTTTYPLRLFRLIMSKPEFPCESRKEVAAELCSFSDEGPGRILDGFTQKLLTDAHFSKQLHHASKTGTFEEGRQELFTLLSIVAKYMKPDVRENERINKLLSMLGDHCPNANLEPIFDYCSKAFFFVIPLGGTINVLFYIDNLRCRLHLTSNKKRHQFILQKNIEQIV